MSLRLSFVSHSKLIFYFGALCIFSSCARKNTRVYNFDQAYHSNIARLDLPYLGIVHLVCDDKQAQCSLTWNPVVIEDIPVGLSLHGYNVYSGTLLKLFGRMPILKIPSTTHSCELVIENLHRDLLFAVAPVFVDQHKNEIIGLLTIAKI